MLASSTAEPATTANEFEIYRLLDRVVGLTGDANSDVGPSRAWANAFLNAKTPAEALEVIFGPKPWPTRRQAISILNHLLGLLDDQIGRQLNVVLHHKSFQQLEAAWRSLAYLTNCVEPFAEGPAVRIRLWNCG
ncbi:MAG: type VI secretion system contractile sheath large subunit, partial [Planctomycetota bacterium]|nr:type VI secretion system contractile sheath large subunit [Planctomycetota bacterium]